MRKDPMSWAAIGVMLMAIVANVRKAADVMLNLGRPGEWLQSWDALLAAVALEAGFALFAFFLARELRGHKRHVGLLVSGTLILGGLSAVANIAYYTYYSPATVGSWLWWQSVILGLSAPTVAVMTAVLAGVAESIHETEEQEQFDREEAARAHVMAIEKERTAQRRADARKAKADAGKVPDRSGTVPEPGGNGRISKEKLLTLYPEATGWTGRQIAEVAGVTPRTGRNWAREFRKGEEDGRREKS